MMVAANAIGDAWLVGLLWLAMMLATVTAPPLAYRAAQNPAGGMEISSAAPRHTAGP